MKQITNRLLRAVIRPFSFLPKEIIQIIRQPRLVLTLIVAPFLVLLLFGIGYTSQANPLTTVLVIPENLGLSTDKQDYEDEFVSPFKLTDVTTDRSWAISQVQSRDIDVAVIFQEDAIEQLSKGEHSEIEVVYNELIPFQADWMGIYSRVQTAEINKRVLTAALESGDQGILTGINNVQTYNESIGGYLQTLQQEIPDERYDDALKTVELMQEATIRIRESVNQIGFLLAAAGSYGYINDQSEQKAPDLTEAQAKLDDIDEILASMEGMLQSEGDPDAEQLERDTNQLDSNLGSFAEATAALDGIPAEVIVSPFEAKELNLAPIEPGFVAFYSPAVLALLVQHIAVTLTALTLVRERLRGTTDLFRISPLNTGELMVGKYIAYFLLTSVMTLVLVVTMLLTLNVPQEGDIADFILALVILISASLGIGFLISAISRTETQAVQLAMLVLLASVFFSGFFLPLESLSQFVWVVSYALPVTYGIETLQELMLRGHLPADWVLVAPVFLALITVVSATMILRFQFRRS